MIKYDFTFKVATTVYMFCHYRAVKHSVADFFGLGEEDHQQSSKWQNRHMRYSSVLICFVCCLIGRGSAWSIALGWFFLWQIMLHHRLYIRLFCLSSLIESRSINMLYFAFKKNNVRMICI